MQHYPDDDSYHIDEASVTVRQENNPTTTATSDMAIMDEGGTRIQLVGNAYIHREPDQKGDMFSIRSERLTLYPDLDKIQTDDPATVINGLHTLQGTGMSYDNTTRQLQVNQNTHVIMTPSTTSRTDAPAP